MASISANCSAMPASSAGTKWPSSILSNGGIWYGSGLGSSRGLGVVATGSSGVSVIGAVASVASAANVLSAVSAGLLV